MKIEQTLAAASLAPALQKFWQLSGSKIDLILKEYDPALEVQLREVLPLELVA
jgi:hypothetical protein